MTDVGVTGFLVLALAACLVGFAKTAIGGAASISVALFAAVLPAKESTGALLPLLLVGDVLAISAYRRHADWSLLVRLFPSVAVGVGAGALFVSAVDDTVMRRTIGAVLLVLVAVHVVRQRRAGGVLVAPTGAARHVAAAVFGVLAGFTTMVANAGGAVMSLYLLTMGLGMMGFLGTTAWFFGLVNAFKVPFSVGLGLIGTSSLLLCAALAPFVVAGGLLGRRVVGRLDQGLFSRIVLVVTVLSGLNLLR
ncbi:sulfite exporter TauE/SafE family protein [Kineococcus glutinatus]|uniref:Probable membrane transporter protein n=1 Tax=Kineococcus glutinatus TaxID=1070872 RepID=A0ABP9I3I8_9ACTN